MLPEVSFDPSASQVKSHKSGTFAKYATMFFFFTKIIPFIIASDVRVPPMPVSTLTVGTHGI